MKTVAATLITIFGFAGLAFTDPISLRTTARTELQGTDLLGNGVPAGQL